MPKRKTQHPSAIAALAREAIAVLEEDGYTTAQMLAIAEQAAAIPDRTGFARAWLEAVADEGLDGREPDEIWQHATALVLAVGRDAALEGFLAAITAGNMQRLPVLALFDAALDVPAEPDEPPMPPEQASALVRRLIRQTGTGEAGASMLLEFLMLATPTARDELARAILDEAPTSLVETFAALAAFSPLPMATRERMLDFLAARGGPAERAFLEAVPEAGIGSELYASARRRLMKLVPAAPRKGRKPSLKGVPLTWPFEAAFATEPDATGSQAFYLVRRRGTNRVFMLGFVASDVRGLADASVTEELSDSVLNGQLAMIERRIDLHPVDPAEAGARLAEGLALAEARRIPLPFEMGVARYMFAGLPVRPAGKARRKASTTAANATIYRIKIVLKGSKPPIWRRVEVADDLTLDRLHGVIQGAMGWEDYHLHAFRTGRREHSGKRLLREVVAPKGKLVYEYDFGDGWVHELTVEKALAPEPGRRYPAVVGGERACPPEDSGGLWGYYDKLEILADSEDPDHEDVAEWMGDFDPQEFDLEAADAAVGRLGRQR